MDVSTHRSEADLNVTKSFKYAGFRSSARHFTVGKPMKKALVAALTLCACATGFASSLITNRLDDPKAVYMKSPAAADDSSAELQEAIDKASGTGREGIVFIPEGRYAITRTVYL